MNYLVQYVCTIGLVKLMLNNHAKFPLHLKQFDDVNEVIERQI